MRAFQQWLHFSLIPPHLSALPAHVVVWKHPGKSVCAQFLQLTPKWTMKWNRSWEFEKFDGKFTKYAHSVTKRFGLCTVYFYPLYIFNKYTVTNKNILHYITLHYIDNSRKKIFALFHDIWPTTVINLKTFASFDSACIYLFYVFKVCCLNLHYRFR